MSDMAQRIASREAFESLSRAQGLNQLMEFGFSLLVLRQSLIDHRRGYPFGALFCAQRAAFTSFMDISFWDGGVIPELDMLFKGVIDQNP